MGNMLSADVQRLRTVSIADLPSSGPAQVVFRDSSFFGRQNIHDDNYSDKIVDLPTPNEVRRKGKADHKTQRDDPRPRPVVFADLGIFVKYGSSVTVAEAQCLWFFNKHMSDVVPTPELYGWRQDKGQVFVYMQLIPGDSLWDAWDTLSSRELDGICKQLRNYAEAWSQLRQGDDAAQPKILSNIAGGGLGDRSFSHFTVLSRGFHANPGPFPNLTAFHDYFAQLSSDCDSEIARRDFPEFFSGLTDSRPVVFTHGDLSRENILVSRHNRLLRGLFSWFPPLRRLYSWLPSWLPLFPRRRVVGITNFHQAGWYPQGWEFLKAQRTCDPTPMDSPVTDPMYHRDIRWLRKVMSPPDDEYTHSWALGTYWLI